MKRIGIIGGIGPESTIDYYRGIIDAFKPGYGEQGFPEIVVFSLNLKELVGYGDRNEWERMADLLVDGCRGLEAAGASFGAIASNTPHRVFKEVQSRAKLPLVSIVDATVDYAKAAGCSRTLLLGTGFTMRSDFYTRALSDAGISVVLPDDGEIDFIQDKLMNEIELGIVTSEAKKGFVSIVNGIIEKEGIDSVILACTELPLVLNENDFPARCIDTVKVHVGAIVERYRQP